MNTELPDGRRFSRRKPILIGFVLVAGLALLLVVAIHPRQQREQEVMEALQQTQGVPTVLVAKSIQVPGRGELLLPGTIQAVSEASLYSRSEGYLRKRMVDIGDHVQAGQLLAVVEAPEVDQQVRQAQATVSRSEAVLAQTKAAREQSDTQLKLAEITARRWNTLFDKRVVSRQETDEKQAAYEARMADNQAAQANEKAANNAVEAARADLQRLLNVKEFQEIRAPFAGIITARNTEVGSLIKAGASDGRELFHLAQIETVRVMVHVPQTNVPAISVGKSVSVTVQERPGVKLSGTLVRTANALDPATRTLLSEVHVANREHLLLPGMYAQVGFPEARQQPMVLISGDTLVVRSDGPQVAVVEEGGAVRYRKVTLGRDFGSETEVTSGLSGGESLVINPSDDVRDGVMVKTRVAKEIGNSSQKK